MDNIVNEVEVKIVTEKELLEAIEKYKEFLYNDNTVSATKFHHYQIALYGCKCLVHDLFETPRESEIAWSK